MAARTRREFARLRRRFGLLTFGLGNAVIGLALLAMALFPAPDDPLGAALFDRYQRASPRPYDPALPVRVVAIDGEALARYGQWPWPRTYLAELLDRLLLLGAASVAFDLVFADPDRASPEFLAAPNPFGPNRSSARQAVEATQNDVIFARRMAQTPTVIPALPLASGILRPLRVKYGMAVSGVDPRPALPGIQALEVPLLILQDSASGIGLTGLGGGAVVRSVPLFQTVGGAIAPALALEALRVALGVRSYNLRSVAATADVVGGGQAGVGDARIGPLTIPLSSDGSLRLRPSGDAPGRVIPAWRILEGEVPDPALRPLVAGQIVFVGATAPGLRYLVTTPLGATVDGVLIHAEIAEQILAGVTLRRPDWAIGAEAAAVLVLGLLGLVVFPRMHPIAGAAVAATLGAVALAVSWIAFTRENVLVSPIYPALALGGVYLTSATLAYLRANAEGRAVRGQFERYVTPEVIREILASPTLELDRGGVQRDLSVLFCDVRGFTTLTEKMEARTLIAYLNRVLGGVSEAVLGRGGTVDKYMGDCVMAFWNAPLEKPDHAALAVASLFDIRRAQDRMNAAFEQEGLPPIALGIGLNTGPCSVGPMGSALRQEYSCVGDPVNVAARLQDLTKVYGVWNLVGLTTVTAAPGWIAGEIDRIQLRGRSKVEGAWSILCADGAREAPVARALAAALGAFHDAREPEARAAALGAIRAADVPGVVAERLATALAQRAPP